MRVRGAVVAALVALVAASCASAADVDSSGSPDQSRPRVSAAKSSHAPTSETPARSTSAPTTPSTTTPPSSLPSPAKRMVLRNSVGGLPSFLTPSRNIGCLIAAGAVRCDILERTYGDPPAPVDCQGDYGQSIAVDRKGIGRLVCATDTVIDMDAPVLQYGTATTVDDFGCVSAQSGVTCYNLVTKHGFALSQAAPSLF